MINIKTKNRAKEEIMIFPCCKKELPAALDLKPEKIWCSCGQSYLLSVIIEYNEMRNIIIGWRDVNINENIQMVCKNGGEKVVVDLLRRGNKFTQNFCSKCGQTDIGQQGEYPCDRCGLPTLWDKEYNKEHLDCRIKKPVGMYGETPRVQIGKFSVSKQTKDKIWIEREDGEGGAFSEKELAKLLQEFYRERF